MPRRLLAPLALGLLALALAPAGGAGRSLSEVRAGIARTQARLEVARGRARVLTTDVARITGEIHALQAGMRRLGAQEAALQADLDAKRAKLLATQAELRTARARLVTLRAQLARARRVLARRLVALYEADHPDVVSVVLSARGFSDMLETGHYVAQIGRQDERIITAVRVAKRETTAAVARLGRLERRQRALAAAVLARRDAVAEVRMGLTRQRNALAAARGARAAVLARINARAGALRRRLDDLEGEQAAMVRRVQAASVAGSLAPAPVGGSGRFVWPVNGTISSPFCEPRPWERCHPGMDIAAPTGTPIRAAAAGTVILAGPSGGYGNYTCIRHTASLSTCYGHQSRIGVSVGQSVSQGQVIGAVGSTGHSTGPHLHFEARVNGGVVNPLNYL